MRRGAALALVPLLLVVGSTRAATQSCGPDAPGGVVWTRALPGDVGRPTSVDAVELTEGGSDELLVTAIGP